MIKTKINYLQTQRFKKLIYQFHFDSVFDILPCVNRPNFFCSIRLPNFVVKETSEIMQHSLSVSHSSNVKILCHPSRPTCFFFHRDSGWSRDQSQPGSFSQRQWKGVQREPGNEVKNILSFSLFCRYCQGQGLFS